MGRINWKYALVIICAFVAGGLLLHLIQGLI